MIKKHIPQENIDGLVPPQSIDLEELVLGACLLESEAFNEVADVLTPECFYLDAHKEIYCAMLDLYKKSHPIDMVTVTQKLKANNKLDLVGGGYFISSLTNRVASTSNLQYHSKLIVQFFLKREMIRLSRENITESYDTHSDIFDLYQKGVAKLESAVGGVIKYEVSDIGKVHSKVLNDSFAVAMNGTKSGIPTGYRNLDNFTNGWQKTDLVILAGRPSMGKALVNSSLVYTPQGSINIGNSKVGQSVLGSDGNEYKITGVHPQGEKEVYRVYFDDYTFVDCCNEHLWEVYTRNERQKKTNKLSVLKTSEMFNNVVVGADRKNYSVKYAKPLAFVCQEIELDPYLLGIYIGDGCSNNQTVRICNPEKDIIEKIKKLLPASDKISSDKKFSNHSITKKAVGGKKSGSWYFIDRLNLIGKKSHEKFIPKEYLINSVNVRTRLLQGLIDTDGCVEMKGRSMIRYCTTSEQLCSNVTDLVRGLGGKSTFVKRVGKYSKNGRVLVVKDYYSIYITMPSEITPVSSEKQLNRYSNKRRCNHKFITEIKKMGYKKEMTCITVDAPDSLFITDGYNLTHNSVCGLAFALNPALRDNIPTAIFSLEMSSDQLVGRCQSTLSGINSSKIIKKQLTIEECQIIELRCYELKRAPIYIDDTPSLSLMELKGKARKLVRDKKVRLIVIDYLQLMTAESSKSGNREQEVAFISKGLKALAKELDIPIIALSQLNRSVETRGNDKKPMLSDLRESGAIEQDADMVIFCYRPEYYGIQDYEVGGEIMATNGLMCLIVSKHRAGSLGELRFKFNGNLTKLENYDSIENEILQPSKLDENTGFLTQHLKEEEGDEMPF